MTRVATLLAVLAAALAAGCGGGGGAEDAAAPEATGADPVEVYLERVRAADAVLQDVRARVGDEGPPGDLGDRAELQADIDQALRGLEEVPPPFELLPQNLPLTQSLGEASDIVAALPDGELTEEDVAPLRAALDEAEAAIAEMEENGHDVRSGG